MCASYTRISIYQYRESVAFVYFHELQELFKLVDKV